MALFYHRWPNKRLKLAFQKVLCHPSPSMPWDEEEEWVLEVQAKVYEEAVDLPQEANEEMG